jgi:ribulose 1,5-bisphosphate carboxylase large subunit-like protein
MTPPLDNDVIVRGAFRVHGSPPTLSEFYTRHKAAFSDLCTEIGRNALVGTFGDFTADIFNNEWAFGEFHLRTRKLGQCFTDIADADITSGRYGFKLRLDHTTFADTDLGLQKLIHVLVSDLFQPRGIIKLYGHVEIESINLGGLMDIFQQHYRVKSHTVPEIRHLLKLEADEPLLAFSLKPRTGLSEAEYKSFTRDVLAGGFHLVEMDTRDPDIDATERIPLMEKLSQLALDESQSGRVRRFSANLSGPFCIIEPALSAIWDLHKRAGTDAWVVKVDGNLDGLSTIQAIRRWCSGNSIPQPIITCYPVLKYGLARYLGSDTLYHLLVLSGADIIYPGGRPRFEDDRSIDGSQISAARSHYEKLRYSGNYPLPSVAGGTLIGHVPATMTLLGTDIAFFVGGGLSLSRQGLREAAIAFRNAVDESRRLLREPSWKRSDILERFVNLTRVYAPKKKTLDPAFELVDPCKLIGKVDTLAIDHPLVTE